MRRAKNEGLKRFQEGQDWAVVKIDKLPSGSFRARVLDYTDEEGKAHYRTFTGKNRRAVQLEAAQFEANKKGNRADNITVDEAITRYAEAKKNVLSPKTYREYKGYQKNYLQGLRDIRIFDLTQEDVQRAVNLEAAEHSPKTVRNAHGLLSASLKMFRPDFVLYTTLPQRKKPDIIIPTEEDVVKLISAVRDTEIELPVLLGALAGMRMSEICGLKWSDVDFKSGIISVRRAKVMDEDNQLIEKATKTKASDRTVKMISVLQAAMKRRYDPEAEYITDLKPHSVYDRYKTVLKKVCPGARYTFHQLRHYAASVMIMLGIPTKYVADMLGHETENMVQEVYGHIMRDKKDIFFDRLDDYYSGVFKRFSENLS